MQAIERNKPKSAAGHAGSYSLDGKESRLHKLGKRFKGLSDSPSPHHEDDDCAVYDKISKQMDDIVEGESPKRFKRPKMESDIIAR